MPIYPFPSPFSPQGSFSTFRGATFEFGDPREYEARQRIIGNNSQRVTENAYTSVERLGKGRSIGLSVTATVGASRIAAAAGGQMLKIAENIFITQAKGTSRAAFARTHEAVAFRMRQALLNTYLQSLSPNGLNTRGGGIYRAAGTVRGKGRLTGKLGDALEDPSMVVGTSDGIGYIDVPLLDGKAAHWRRMNYGSGPNPGMRPQDFQVTLTGLSVNVKEPTPPGSKMPLGIFYDSASGKSVGFQGGAQGLDPFTPISQRFTSHIVGNKAKNFFDPPLRVLATELPVRYGQMWDRWFKDGINSAPKAVRSAAALALQTRADNIAVNIDSSGLYGSSVDFADLGSLNIRAT